MRNEPLSLILSSAETGFKMCRETKVQRATKDFISQVGILQSVNAFAALDVGLNNKLLPFTD